MKPKFRIGEDIYVVKKNEEIVHGDVIENFRYVENARVRCLLTGAVRGYSGYGYWLKDRPKWVAEPALRKRPQPGEFSFDEIMNQLKQPISKNILTEQ